MQLKLGKMTSREVAMWLGISAKGYSNNIDKYQERIKPFAKFTKVYGGIIVEEIYIPEYDKSLNAKIDELFMKEMMSANDNLMTVTGMSRKYSDEMKISERQLRRLFTESRDRLFGIFENGSFQSTKGIMGVREAVWAIKVSNYNHYRFLMPEETELLDVLIKRYYGALDPQTVKDAALLEEIFRTTDMTKEQYFELKEKSKYNFFSEVIRQFRDATGQMIVHANRYEIDDGYDFTLDDNQLEYKKRLLNLIDELREESL